MSDALPRILRFFTTIHNEADGSLGGPLIIGLELSTGETPYLRIDEPAFRGMLTCLGYGAIEGRTPVYLHASANAQACAPEDAAHFQETDPRETLRVLGLRPSGLPYLIERLAEKHFWAATIPAAMYRFSWLARFKLLEPLFLLPTRTDAAEINELVSELQAYSQRVRVWDAPADANWLREQVAEDKETVLRFRERHRARQSANSSTTPSATS
jgi:hypothetical protein